MPPPPAEVPHSLGALEFFLHSDDLPRLMKIGLAHQAWLLAPVRGLTGFRWAVPAVTATPVPGLAG